MRTSVSLRVVAAIVLACGAVEAVAQRQVPVKVQQTSAATASEKDITATKDNGIFVTNLEQYDDATLQSMLEAARIRLAGMSVLDASTVSARIGGLQGASSSNSGFAVNVNGPSLPGVSTTANSGGTTTQSTNGTSQQLSSGTTNNGTTTTTGSSGNSQTTTLTVTQPTSQSGATTNNSSTTTTPSQTVTTTQSAVTPTAPTAPTQAGFSLPSGFNPSASDILTEQLQTTSDIMAFQLLLTPSLTSRYMSVPENGTMKTLARRRVTIGVPVDIEGAGQHRDEVAEVTLTVKSTSDSFAKGSPIVTTLLPQEKTYNVAAVTNHTASIGGGIATSIMSVGATWLWGHQTYYVVKDQDTVAYQRSSADDETTVFGWQFRPTLGRHYVKDGPRRVYVQLAFPFDGTGDIGSVVVTTAWRKYDTRHGVIAKNAQTQEEAAMSPDFVVQNYDLKPQPSNANLVDNADGTVTVHIEGSFAAGTVIESGAHTYTDGSPHFTRTEFRIEAVVPEGDVALNPLYAVDPSGAHIQVTAASSQQATSKCFTLGSPVITAATGTSVLLKLPVTIPNPGVCVPQNAKQPTQSPAVQTTDLVAVVGTQVFGFRDNPFAALDDTSLTIVVPTDTLRANPRVTVLKPLWGEKYAASTSVALGGAHPTIAQATVVEQSASQTVIALTGTGLSHLKPLVPTQTQGVTLSSQTDAYVLVTLTTSALPSGVKQLVFDDGFGVPLLVAMPATDKNGPTLTKHDPIKVGTTSLVVAGKGLGDLTGVTLNDKPLTYTPKKPTANTKQITITLPDDMRGKAGTYSLIFHFGKSDPMTYTVTVKD
jgi:hypothetical protein